MKKALRAFLLLLAVSAVQARGDNLIRNGGF